MKPPHYPWLIFICAGIMALNGCRTSGAAFSANSNAYMAKPIYQDQKTGAVYLSGRIIQGHNPDGIENNMGGEVSAHFSVIEKHYFLSAGGFGYWGKYNFVSVFGNRNYVGGGMRAEMGGRIPFQSPFDLLLGLAGEIYREDEDFVRRSQNLNSDFYTLGLSRTSMNVAPTLDVRFFPTHNFVVGMRYSLDTYLSFANLVTAGIEEIRHVHRLTVHTFIHAATLYGQIGLTPSNQNVYSLGMSYGIPLKKKPKPQ